MPHRIAPPSTEPFPCPNPDDWQQWPEYLPNLWVTLSGAGWLPFLLALPIAQTLLFHWDWAGADLNPWPFHKLRLVDANVIRRMRIDVLLFKPLLLLSNALYRYLGHPIATFHHYSMSLVAGCVGAMYISANEVRQVIAPCAQGKAASLFIPGLLHHLASPVATAVLPAPAGTPAPV